MKKTSPSLDVTINHPANQIITEAQKQVADSKHQLPKTTKKSRPTTNENSLSTTDITLLKNYSHFFVEPS